MNQIHSCPHLQKLRIVPILPIALAVLAFCSLSPSALAEESAVAEAAGVLRSSEHDFSVRHQVTIEATPAEVYRALTEDVSEWWDAAHTLSGDSSNLSIEARAQGCFCETLANGGSVRHLTVVNADPGTLLRLTGGLGPLQTEAVAGSMSWALEELATGTRLTLTYNVSGSVDSGLDGWAGGVAGVLREQLDRLAVFVGSRTR